MFKAIGESGQSVLSEPASDGLEGSDEGGREGGLGEDRDSERRRK